MHNLANWTVSGTNDWWVTPINDNYFHVNNNRYVSLLYCFYVCVLCFSVPFFRKPSCFLWCSRVPYSRIAPSGSLIPGDPSSVTFGLRAVGIETWSTRVEMFRLWVTAFESDTIHNSLVGESLLSESVRIRYDSPQFIEGFDPRSTNSENVSFQSVWFRKNTAFEFYNTASESAVAFPPWWVDESFAMRERST